MKSDKNRNKKRAEAVPESGLFGQSPLIRPFATVALVDIRRAFEPFAGDYPPILNLRQAAKLAGVAPSTLKRHVSEGMHKDSVSRGKPLRFWRDLFVQDVMKDKKSKKTKQDDEGDEAC
jgi:hypothetical protein